MRDNRAVLQVYTSTGQPKGAAMKSSKLLVFVGSLWQLKTAKVTLYSLVAGLVLLAWGPEDTPWWFFGLVVLYTQVQAWRYDFGE